MIQLTEEEIRDARNSVSVYPLEQLEPILRALGYSEESIKRNLKMVEDLKNGIDSDEGPEDVPR